MILLAGGLGSRLGSDKALQPVAGKPMIRHIIDRVSGLSDEILVVIARNAPSGKYDEALPDFTRVIMDELEGKTPIGRDSHRTASHQVPICNRLELRYPVR